MATSEKRIAANRANAKKSTGPRTTGGKTSASRNSLTHGILSRELVIDTENPEEYAALFASLLDAHKPLGATEQLLVEKMAIALWKMKRLNAVETAMIKRVQLTQGSPISHRRPDVQEAIEKAELTIAALPPIDDRLIRYQAQLEGQYYRAMAMLLSLQPRRDQSTALELPAPQTTGGLAS